MATALFAAVACGGDEEPLVIGFLGPYTGGLAELAPPIENGAQLAVAHINEAGGVNGQPIRLVTGDTQLDPTHSVAEAGRLANVEGVSAIVGPVSSLISLPLGEAFAASAQVPVISPSAASIAFANVDDNDFLFRTSLSLESEGKIMAIDVVERLGMDDNVGVLYRNDAWGDDFATSFEANYDGDAILVSYELDATSFEAELREAARDGARSLLIPGFAETDTIVREALANDLFDRFYFTGGNRSDELPEEVGIENVEGAYGTAPGVPATEEGTFTADYLEMFGTIPPGVAPAYVRGSYDAVVAIALAAQAAGSNDSVAIRDQLRAIGNSPGLRVIPSIESIRAGLEALSDGEAVDFNGAVTPLDWDDRGDVSSGFINIWQYQDGTAVDLQSIPVSAN